MGRKKPFFEQLTIEKIAAEGKSIVRKDNHVIFVEGVIPGDVVDVKITRKKKNYMEGRPVRFHKYSEDREPAFCEHFGTCGGCKWQYLPYAQQLAFKQQQVTDAFERIGKLHLPQPGPAMASPQTRFYRNKMEYTFSATRWIDQDEPDIEPGSKAAYGLGLHVPRFFDKVVDIQKCHLQPDPSNAIRNAIRQFALENDYTYYHIRNHTGLLRTLIIRTSQTTGETMVIVVFGSDAQEARRKALLEFLQTRFPEITSLYYIINTKKNDSIGDQTPVLFAGQAYITETMEDLAFRIGPKSFYQTNSAQALQLYQKVRQWAGLEGNETVYDLYTGTGTIASFVARQAEKVIGLEYVEEAVADARENARRNGLDNIEFFAGDMKDILTPDFVRQQGRPDVLIADPPRAGMHKDVVETIRQAAPRRIVYVSCNPATQARDIGLLSDHYRVEAYQPVDMFPHTYHVENIALLVRNNNSPHTEAHQ